MLRFIFIFIIIFITRFQMQQQCKFKELLQQIKLYIEQDDRQSLQFLLEGQSSQKINQIRDKLSIKEQITFDQIVQLLKKIVKKPDFIKNVLKQHHKIKAIHDQSKAQQSQQQLLENYEKQFKMTGIQYGSNYSYPFYELIQKMSLIYFQRSHPNPFPQQAIKMLHSQIQTLFVYVFSQDARQNFILRKKKSKRGFINQLKQYLFFIFQQEYHKFIKFSKVFKKIKNEISQKQSNQKQQKSIQTSPLIQSQNMQQIDYLISISKQIKNQQDYKNFIKIKSLNFLHFGQLKLSQFISNDFFKQPFQSINKQIFQLLSFIICRFLRKIILATIRRKNHGKLLFFTIQQQIQAIDVKIIGNYIIDVCKKKSQQYFISQQTLEQKAKRIFMQQFYQYDYQTVIPPEIIQKAQRKLKEWQILKVNQQNGQNKQTIPQYIWQNHKQYKSLWSQRILAQQYINQQPVKGNKKQMQKTNEYSKFIEINIIDFQKNNSLLWLRYLTMSHLNLSYQNQIKSKQSISKAKQKENSVQGRKRIKLESLST